MCFSLQASSIAAGGLITFGAICFAQNIHNKTRYIALVPLLFGIQQIAEALIWGKQEFSLTQETILYASYFFLSFAYIVWPLWVPFSIWYAEQNQLRKKYLYFSIATGIVTATSLFYTLIAQTLTTQIQCSHIVYTIYFPNWSHIPVSIAYLCSTILPWIMSSIPKLWIVGLTLIASYAISLWMYTHAFTSVWCFFAAILSCIIALVLTRYNKGKED